MTHILVDVFGGQKITHKATDVAENLQLYRVVRFSHPISSCSENNIKCGRTEQLYIFYRITGFTSDFLSFIVVEHIRFFHRAI